MISRQQMLQRRASLTQRRSSLFSTGSLAGSLLWHKKAQSFLTCTGLPQVFLSSSIADVLREFETAEYVLVDTVKPDGTTESSVLCRVEFFKAITGYDDATSTLQDIHLDSSGAFPLTDPYVCKLRTIKSRLRFLPSVSAEEKSQNMVTQMLRAGHESVAVVAGGVVIGIASLTQVLKEIQRDVSLGNMLVLNQEQKEEPGKEDHLSARNISLPSVPKFPDEKDSNKVDFRGRSGGRSVAAKSTFSEGQLVSQAFCSSVCTQLQLAAFVSLDIAITFSDWFDGSGPGSAAPQCIDGSSPPSTWLSRVRGDAALVATGIILAFYIYEASLRLYGYGKGALNMLIHPAWVLDLVIVYVSVIIYVLVFSELVPRSSTVATCLRILRLVRVTMRVVELAVAARIRRAISRQKSRFRRDGFDLDLTYVTKSCIAMSLPALASEAMYRNPITEVQRFFDTYHRDAFLIFNLCAERHYDPSFFDGRVERIEIEDHNPPHMSQIVTFLSRSWAFMQVRAPAPPPHPPTHTHRSTATQTQGERGARRGAVPAEQEVGRGASRPSGGPPAHGTQARASNRMAP